MALTDSYCDARLCAVLQLHILSRLLGQMWDRVCFVAPPSGWSANKTSLSGLRPDTQNEKRELSLPALENCKDCTFSIDADEVIFSAIKYHSLCTHESYGDEFHRCLQYEHEAELPHCLI